MFDGYWGRPEATVEMYRNLWMHSGDIGRLDADRFLYFMDRKADYMRRRGENVSSYELEEVLIRHPAVADVAVYAVPSPVTEDDIMVVVELAAGATVTEEELFRWLVDQVPVLRAPALRRDPRRAAAERHAEDPQGPAPRRGRAPDDLGPRAERHRPSRSDDGSAPRS